MRKRETLRNPPCCQEGRHFTRTARLSCRRQDHSGQWSITLEQSRLGLIQTLKLLICLCIKDKLSNDVFKFSRSHHGGVMILTCNSKAPFYKTQRVQQTTKDAIQWKLCFSLAKVIPFNCPQWLGQSCKFKKIYLSIQLQKWVPFAARVYLLQARRNVCLTLQAQLTFGWLFEYNDRFKD